MARKIFALIRTAFFATLFLSLWLWFLPRWAAGPDAYAGARAFGLLVLALGIAIAGWCAFEFAWRGLGTPAPFDPPRRLVISGAYRYVRNPMYVGGGIATIGEAIAFPHLTGFMLIMTAALWVASTIFIAIYEEPVLRRMFGDDYVTYCANVRRWIPRLTPFDMPKVPAVE
ncbi:MAG TPA: isoprenylcysteine carboxylmethyltransferase family protein [Thermoanaerobaculia bacterium]|nr:isoprenylcysteine carboxylmethyltransferase family protein [Thermoanaerobaculia bacterium]